MTASTAGKYFLSAGVGIGLAILGHKVLECKRCESDASQEINSVALNKKKEGTGHASPSTKNLDEFSEEQDGKSIWSKLKPSWFFVRKDSVLEDEANVALSAEPRAPHAKSTEEHSNHDAEEKNGYDELLRTYEEATKVKTET